MCPPGTDQTTRGRQLWHILAPELQQLQRPNGTKVFYFGDKEEDVGPLGLKWHFGAFEKLARPALLSTGAPTFASTSAKKESTTLSPIERLPPELTSLILTSSKLSKQDIISLGLSSPSLWPHILRHIASYMRKSLAPWAGTPLIYTGTYLTTLPDTIHALYPSIKEEEKLYDANMKTSTLGRGCPMNGRCPARRWNWNAVGTFKNIENQDLSWQWREALKTVSSPIVPPMPWSMKFDLDRALKIQSDPEVDGQWYLRNLITKEFVRLDVVRKDSHVYATVQGTPWLCLDLALLGKLRWTNANQLIHPPPIEDQNGKWAGHKFDIVRNVSADWKDATDTVIPGDAQAMAV